MLFPTVLALFFCGWPVRILADFYVEIKAPTSSSTTAPIATYLYVCVGIPQGTPALRTTQSWCTPVNSYVEKIQIHATYTFFSMYRPELRGHVITLSDRGVLVQDEWNMGFSNYPIDHPNFGPPNQGDLSHFGIRVAQMGGEGIFEMEEAQILTHYFAQANVISYLGNLQNAYTHLTVFSTVLQRIINEYGNIDRIRNANRAEQLRNKVNGAMMVALRKMLDPCTFLRGDYQPYAPLQCEIYCKFLNIVTLNYGPASDRCTSIVGGHCELAVCMCTRASSSIFRGCLSSPMRMCHNALRVKLDL